MRGLLVLANLLGLGCAGIVRARLVPSERFSRASAPAAPDYADPSSWAALPDRKDGADAVPVGERDGQTEARADVFFIHPTTYYDDASWNQPLDDEDANALVDDAVLRNQASAFNAAGRIYAPRYRQATLGAFLVEDDRRADAEAALDLAYDDVLRAFDHWRVHSDRGRPIVLASHSQGSRHAIRLLADRFTGTPLRDRLVAAYVVGLGIPTDVFERVIPDIPLCAAPDQTGCVATWSTMEEGADLDRFRAGRQVRYRDGYESNDGKTLACVNPLSWRADGVRVPKSANPGSVRFEDEDPPEPDRAIVGARCEDGVVRIEEPPRAYRRLLGRVGDYHLVDYSLFYLSLRRNAVRRTAALGHAHPG